MRYYPAAADLFTFIHFDLYFLASDSISDLVFCNSLNADFNNTLVLFAASSFSFSVVLSAYSQYDLQIASTAAL